MALYHVLAGLATWTVGSVILGLIVGAVIESGGCSDERATDGSSAGKAAA